MGRLRTPFDLLSPREPLGFHSILLGRGNRGLLRMLLPPRRPPLPNFPPTPLPTTGGGAFVSVDLQLLIFLSPFSTSSLSSDTVLRLAAMLRAVANHPPFSRERKMGRKAGAEAVISARLVSMAEVTNPTLPSIMVLGKMDRAKRPWIKRRRRMIEVIVTLQLSGDDSRKGREGLVEGELTEIQEER